MWVPKSLLELSSREAEIHRIAQHRVVDPRGRADEAAGHLAAGDPDAHIDLDAVGPGATFGAHEIGAFERRLGRGASGVRALHRRHVPHREHRIADEFVDIAAMLADHIGQQPQIFVEQGNEPVRLTLQALGQAGITDDIDEHDGCGAPYGRQGFRIGGKLAHHGGCQEGAEDIHHPLAVALLQHDPVAGGHEIGEPDSDPGGHRRQQQALSQGEGAGQRREENDEGARHPRR